MTADVTATSQLATALALAAIRGYRRYLSPYKGFSCALAAGTGGASCSAYGYAVIARFGLERGLGLLDRRLALCGHVYRRMAPPCPAPVHPRRKYQQGFCDGPCDLPCDGPGHCHLPCDGHGHGGGGVGKTLLDCACDALNPCNSCDSCDGCDRLKRWRENRRGPRMRNPQHLDAAAERIRRQQARKREERKPHRSSAEANPKQNTRRSRLGKGGGDPDR